MTASNEYAKVGEFKPIDLLAAAAAREVIDGDVVFAGTGLPMLAIALAQNEHAPNAACIYEAGSIDGRPIDLPTSVGDARCAYQAAKCGGLFETFYGQLHAGYVTLGFLGGAEIDKYGSLNTTYVGTPASPKQRFTGSGGNADILSFAQRTVLIMVQEKRRFSERLEYVTSPGWAVRNWPKNEYVPKKQIYGKYCYGGPAACITDMAIFRFDDNGIMYLDTVHPGFSAEDVKNNVDFDLDISKCAGETKPPTYKQLEILYKIVDPEGIFLP